MFEQMEEGYQLLQLPSDVLKHILALLCSGDDAAVVNQSILALRLTSKAAAAASDAARTSITLHLSHLTDAIPYLQKLGGLKAATFCTTLDDNPTLSMTGVTAVTKHIPHLESLTLRSGNLNDLVVRDVSDVLLPWRHSLKRLNLQGCFLTTTLDGGDASDVQQSWSPDLPFLELLVMTSGSLRSLDLTGCPALKRVRLNLQASLTDLGGLPTLKALIRLWCCDCPSLADLHLNSSTSLRLLRVETCDLLVSLDASGCRLLQDAHVAYNSMLTCICLAGCGSLKQLVCAANTGVKSLDISGCLAIKKMLLVHNPLLKQLCLSGLKALQKISCKGSHALERLQLTGCLALVDTHVENNSLLTSLDLSGCASITKLTCRHNSSLLSVNLAACSRLQHLDLTGCDSLVSADVSACAALTLVEGRASEHGVGVVIRFESTDPTT